MSRRGGTLDSASVLSGDTTSSNPRSKAPIFSLETFSSKDFIVKDIVEALSESATPVSRRSQPAGQQAAFDPKPLIRAFEAALSRLGSLSEELEERENELSGAVRRAESQHNTNAQTLGARLSSSVESFHYLDRSLNAGVSDTDVGGNVAVRIGERLEELDKQRQRAQDAKFLIQCWLEVSGKGKITLLEDMRSMGGAEKVRCAHIARQLLKISTRLDGDIGSPSNFERVTNGNGRKKSAIRYPTREIIEKFLEGLEKDLLKQFDDFYRRQNFDGMKECAVALRDFNDGASVMATFVNQHQFFIDRSQLITEEVAGDGDTWDRLADPDTEPPGVEPSLQSLVDEVRLVVQEESFIIKRAFPYYEEVLTRFVQRVFQQSIQQRLEMVLDKANSISSLAFLRSLQAARSYIAALVEDLKSHGLTEYPETASSAIASTLDQQLDDLFVPYFVGSSYIEREKKNLEELYSSLLLKFTIYHSRRRKMPTTMLGAISQRSKEFMSSARDAYMERLDSADLPASQKAMLLRIAGMKDSEGGKKDIDVTDEDGQLSLPNAKRMLKWIAEGVGRGLELNGGNETPKDVQALLNLLLLHMGEIYLDAALDAASDQAAAQESTKQAPEFTYFPSLRASISILHLLTTSINTVLLPLASPNLSIRRDIEKATANAIAALEAKIGIILHRTIDASLAWTSRQLAQQKKTDFRPRDDDALIAEVTPTCLGISSFLSRTATSATAALSGRNLAVFLSELAIGLRSLLLEHFRKFSVSLTGGLVISRDVTKYAEMVKQWPTNEELESGAMDVLSEVANLFVIGPEALRERLRAAKGEERAELKQYITKREDANSVGIQAVLTAI